MVKSCCIESCTVTGDDAEYFKFPMSKTLRAAWVAALGLASGAVCGAHFAEDAYRHTRGQRRLKPTAVPSLLLHKKTPPEAEKETTELTTNTNTEATSTNKEQNKESTNVISEKEETGQSETAVGTIDKSDGATDKVEGTIETESIEKAEKVTEKVAEGVKENGDTEGSKNDNSTEEKDIEDIITPYQIKQTKLLPDSHPQPPQALVPAIVDDRQEPRHKAGSGGARLDGSLLSALAQKLDSELAHRLASRLDGALDGKQLGLGVEAAPVFIEVSADKAGNPIDSGPSSPQDCLMLLESVQCDIDPASLMLPARSPDTDSDMEVVETQPPAKENADPISLLTSSDEDEVIIEEPDIPTLEVSDETDEDDRPLQALLKSSPKPTKPSTEEKKTYNIGLYDFYCVQCDYKTSDSAEFKKHNIEIVHSRAIQICPTCGYTTASKAQFSRHKRKHKDERNFKCHLCNYKARHSMSLMYHLKSHNAPTERRAKFTCDKCGFYSDEKKEGLNHIRTCNDGGRLSCDLCSYSTKRKSDMRRHRMRRHSIDDNDADFCL